MQGRLSVKGKYLKCKILIRAEIKSIDGKYLSWFRSRKEIRIREWINTCGCFQILKALINWLTKVIKIKTRIYNSRKYCYEDLRDYYPLTVLKFFFIFLCSPFVFEWTQLSWNLRIFTDTQNVAKHLTVGSAN